MTEAIKPLTPGLSTRPGKLYSPECNCGCSNFVESKNVPVITIVEDKVDHLQSAKDAIDEVFKLFSNNECKECKEQEIQDQLKLPQPKDFTNGVKVNDAFVSLVTKKILDAMQGRIAIIDKVNDVSVKCNHCTPCSGNKIEYLVVEKSEVVKPDSMDNSKDENSAESKVKSEFGESAVDGIIEDLKGPIEVVTKK